MLGLPTYIGKVHPACGTSVRYIRGGCVHCMTVAPAAKKTIRAEQYARAVAEYAAERAAERAEKMKQKSPRQIAAEAGLTTYARGRIHEKCGTDERYTNNGGCVRCARGRFVADYYPKREERLLRKQIEAEAEVARPLPERALDAGPKPTRFFTGRPCKHGHVAERLISSGACVECMSIRDNEKRKTREYRDRRNARTAAERAAARVDAPCTVCGVPFDATALHRFSAKICSPECWSEQCARRYEPMVCEDVTPKKPSHMPMAQWKAEQVARFKKPTPTEVDIEAMAEARRLTKEKRDISHLINADAYRARNVRGGAEYTHRRTEALAVARLMIPDTLKSVKGYRNKVKAALDFVKTIGAQHPSQKQETSNVTL
jgi:hypothetical protein